MKLLKKIALLGATMFTVGSAQAQTTVPVYWPFSLASTHAAMVRTIVEELNQHQKEYTFIFVHKPGAGGSIAANTLLDLKSPALMAATSSFFIRPNLYPSNSHNLSKFRTIGSYCNDQPLALMSTKYKTVQETAGRQINIGVIPGSITHLTAIGVNKSKSIDLNPVFYQGTPEMTKDVIGGHLDVSVDFLSSAVQFKDQINVLGITGTVNHGSAKTFASQGITGMNQTTHANFIIFPEGADPRLIEITRQALSKVLESTRLQDSCKQEFGVPVLKVMSQPEADKLFTKQTEFWRTQSNGIVIEK